MKRILFLLPVLALALGTAGCVKLHSDTVIKDDGSGTAVMEIGIGQAMLEAVREMQELDPGSGGDMDMPDFSDIKRDRIEKAVKPYDVTVTEFEHSSTDEKESIRIGFAFKDLKGLSAAMAATMDQDAEQGMGIYATDDGNYVLKSAVYDFSDMPRPEGEDEEEAEEVDPDAPTEQTPEQMQRQMELLGKMMAAMSEMDIQIRITVPGDIIETNAPQQEGRTSIWSVNSSNMMTAGSDMDPVIKFSGKGLEIKSVIKE